MAEHRLSNDLPPALEAVLNSLNVSLEAELNRYRRTRHIHNAPEDDIFADLDAVIEASSDLNFDLSVAQPSIAVSAVAVAAPEMPPPPPRNKKLLAAQIGSHADADQASLGAIAHPSALVTQPRPEKTLEETPEVTTVAPPKEALSDSASNEILAFKGLLTSDTENSTAVVKTTASSSYLASSEKLIESLTDVAAMPEPIDLNFAPRRKTLSLMAGAALGLLALIAGLGASYVMSNPNMAQTLASSFSGDGETTDPLSESTFDPPGPDLSAQEFVDLKLDNLSSLDMRTSPDPLSTAATPLPSGLPPIESAASPIPTSVLPQAPVTATQALSIPAGSNYYVTVPFSTEQGLIEIRKAIEEAFVRQFSDGNRIQLAVFDNPEAAQSFIAEMQTQGVQAQIYGPTAE